jgi:hypothetical protein
MLDYTKIDLDTQLEHIASELPSAQLLARKADMWTEAANSLSNASQNFQSSTRTLAPDWQDAVGQRWLEQAEASQRTLTTWDQNVNGNNPSQDLAAVSAAIPPTHETVLKFKQIADALKPLASNPLMGAAIQQIILQLQQAAGALMNKLAKDYAAAGDKVAAAGSGGNWEGIQGGSISGSARAADFSNSGPSSVSSAAVSVDPGEYGDASGQASAAAGESGVDGSADESEVDSMSPELSGGGGLAPPTVAPVTPPATAPPVVPATAAPGGMPVVPMAGAAFGRGAGRSSGGGVRMPVVAAPRTGPAHIPVAAAPVSPLAAPSPAAAPAVPQPLSAPPAAVTGQAGAGAVPPLMPMTGAAAGLGGGGSTAGIGAGLARRPVRRPEDEDTSTPGLPPMLSGKAGVADPFTLATRQRTVPDAPATVEFIDEDLWQQEPARTGAEREVR